MRLTRNLPVRTKREMRKAYYRNSRKNKPRNLSSMRIWDHQTHKYLNFSDFEIFAANTCTLDGAWTFVLSCMGCSHYEFLRQCTTAEKQMGSSYSGLGKCYRVRPRQQIYTGHSLSKKQKGVHAPYNRQPIRIPTSVLALRIAKLNYKFKTRS